MKTVIYRYIPTRLTAIVHINDKPVFSAHYEEGSDTVEHHDSFDMWCENEQAMLKELKNEFNREFMAQKLSEQVITA